MTGSQEVIDRFGRSASAGSRLRNWRADRSKQEVVPRVISHVTKIVDSLRPEDVLELCERIAADPSKHALGDIKRCVVKQAPAIRDWHPAFAFTHLLHFVTEAAGRLPMYDELVADQIFRDALFDDAQAQVRLFASEERRLAKDAIRWRIGNAYYSFLREQYVISLLRSHGFEVQQHPLADALFRVDCWVGNTNIDLYVINPFFRDEVGGRKVKSADLLGDAVPPFKNFVLAFETRHTFGDVHLPDAADVRRACEGLSA